MGYFLAQHIDPLRVVKNTKEEINGYLFKNYIHRVGFKPEQLSITISNKGHYKFNNLREKSLSVISEYIVTKEGILFASETGIFFWVPLK